MSSQAPGRAAGGAYGFTVIVWLRTLILDALTLTDCWDCTGLVVTVNCADVAPAGTVTDGGTWTTAGFSDCSVTRAPPAGAGPFSVTVPSVLFPPCTVRGLTTKENRLGVWTVMNADWLLDPNDPVTRTLSVVGVGIVVMAKSNDVAPAGTFTLAGTETMPGLSDVSVIVTPESGTGRGNVNVPIALCPPTTTCGAMLSERIVKGCTVTTVSREDSPLCAVSVMFAPSLTGLVATLNSTNDAPAGTSTDGGS